MTASSQPARTSARLPLGVGCVLLATIAVYFLWEEHEAHLRGALPYLLLLACPLIHLFMRRGHDHGSHGSGARHDADGPEHPKAQ